MAKTDVVELLREGTAVRIRPKGMSMVPFIYPDRDEVVISPVSGELRKYDVILYRSRETGRLTLHRIMDMKNGIYYMCGDNQTVIEEISEDQIFGRVTEIVRNGKTINTDDIKYRTAAILFTKNKKTIGRIRKLVRR